MPNRSRWTLDIPGVTLPTYVFGSSDGPLPQKACFMDADRPHEFYLTYEDYRLWAKRLAAGLQAAGLQKGDVVQMYSANHMYYPVILLGVVMAGGIFTGSNPTYNAREVAYQLENSGAKFLICANSALNVGLEAAGHAKLSKKRVFVCDEGMVTFKGQTQGKAGCKHWTSLLSSVQDGHKFVWRDDPSLLDDTIVLNYSSGTTGLPKGVEITHTNYVSNTLQHMHMSSLQTDYEQNRDALRWMCFLPMYHALAQTVYCVGAPRERIPVYMMAKFDLQKMLAGIERFRISNLQLVPPVVLAMSKSPETKKYDLSSLMTVTAGAAPLGREVSQAFNKLWPQGKMNLKQGYGMTEVTCACIGWDPNKTSDSFAIGEPYANVTIKLVDPEDGKTEVRDGEPGEIWIKAPNVMKGYWRNPKATAETKTADGWLRSGDIAYKDEHGHYFIVDRMKELIKVKGLQVAPAELESILLDHEAIVDAAVIGVTINGDESPRAYVVKAPGREISEKDVTSFMESKVSRHKRLAGGVRFVDSILKNPSGKILRKLYRDQAKEEVGDSAKKEARL